MLNYCEYLGNFFCIKSFHYTFVLKFYIMQEEIITKAAEMFISLGFKSVTMDDIANEMGISKKTIYQHFENKDKLVHDCTMFMYETISHGIDGICEQELNPIEELYAIKDFILLLLKDEKTSPVYQLQKYYKKTYKDLHEKEFCKMQECVLDNLNRGIRDGYYREKMNLEFISRIYYASVHAIKEQELFKPELFTNRQLEDLYLEYHLRAIITEKGRNILENIITKRT
jgi:TetR/AcrR family transcriptional regulator, cholesterol catabolism regulator